MALLTINQNPTVTDTILFDLYTTDVNNNLVNPYEVNQVIIYFVQRDYTSSNLGEYNFNINGYTSTFYYKDATPFAIFGDDTTPAWISSDTADAFLTQINFTPSGDIDIGHFQLQWTPESAREGDYFLCYTWTPIMGGSSLSTMFRFYLGGSSIAVRDRANPVKYRTMLERYTPDMFKQYLSQSDITPETIQNTNLAVADGFTELESLSNQLLDLLDANVVQETFLPYLANTFRWTLRSSDPTLWRRQVRNAIPLYKKKGTLNGLIEVLDECGIKFNKITYYWQVVSQSTWQEAFIVQDTDVFCLSKIALLPVDAYNFSVWYRPQGTTTYETVSLSLVSTTTNSNCVNNSVETICVAVNIMLNPGDEIVVLYKIAEPVDQQLETYIQSLSLADQRDEFTITYPVKNWNVRLIAEDDALFDSIIPIPHPFVYPVVYGKRRTEFPYSEQIYNMDSYNGKPIDSGDPCDLDYTFYDVCSACRSSNISIDITIEELSNDRITEAEAIITSFIPFHAVLHSINYFGSQNEIIPPPIEELECLIQGGLNDNLIFSQFDFDRIILNGASPANITRDMLADAIVVVTGVDGVGYNTSYSLWSPFIRFDEIGIGNSNLLEILSGVNTGSYSLVNNDSRADVVGVSQTDYGFPFRFSNIQYTQSGVNVYQDNVFVFSDSNVNFSLFPIPNGGTWVIKIASTNYPILNFNPDNTLILSGWTGGSTSNISYQLNAPGNINVTSGTTGNIVVNNRGRVETQYIATEVARGDYVLIGSTQYQILFILTDGATYDKVYIDGYSGGDQTVNIQILRRLLDNLIGNIDYRGMRLHTTTNYEIALDVQNGQNPPVIVLENNAFMENFLVAIGTQYYQMVNINGNDIYLSGPQLSWGTTGYPGVNYTIVQFVKHSTSIQSGLDGVFRTFEPFVDRRGDGSNFVTEESMMMPMMLRAQVLNNDPSVKESIQAKEDISYTIITKEE